MMRSKGGLVSGPLKNGVSRSARGSAFVGAVADASCSSQGPRAHTHTHTPGTQTSLTRINTRYNYSFDPRARAFHDLVRDKQALLPIAPAPPLHLPQPRTQAPTDQPYYYYH
jgi:hypothetical protein